MELRRFHSSVGDTLAEAVVEGRMLVRTSLGARRSVSAAEAEFAFYCAMFPVDNRTPPLYVPTPSIAWALREGWDRDPNVPFDATVHLTYPGYKEGQTIPSGNQVVLLGKGNTITVGSGEWVYDASVVAGTLLEVEYSGDDRGKLKKDAGGTVIAICREVSSSEVDAKLTFDIL